MWYKIKSLVFFFLTLCAFLPKVYAQYTYKSVDFEEKGVSEYIYHSFNGLELHYWVNQGKFVNIVTNWADGYNVVVNFPNAPEKKYIIQEPAEAGLYCIHPDGKKQFFKRLPSVFSSEDFEKTGVVEYIECDVLSPKSWIYFTNINPQKRIVLIPEYTNFNDVFPISLRFPNSTIVFRYQDSMSCERFFQLIHPDGRRQTFELNITADFE